MNHNNKIPRERVPSGVNESGDPENVLSNCIVYKKRNNSATEASINRHRLVLPNGIERGESKRVLLKRRMSVSKQDLFNRSESSHGNEQEERFPFPPCSKEKTARQRPTSLRRTLEVPCAQRLRTNDGAEDVVENGPGMDFDGVVSLLGYKTGKESEIVKGESSLFHAYFHRLSGEEKHSFLSSLLSKHSDQQRLTEFILKYIKADSREDLQVMAEDMKTIIPVETVRLVEVDNNIVVSKCLISDQIVTDTCIAKHCAWTKKLVLLNDVDTQLPFSNENLEEGASSIISIPLGNTFRSTGTSALVLQLINKTNPVTGEESLSGFTEWDQIFAQKLAAAFGQAAEKLHLTLQMDHLKSDIKVFASVAMAVCSEEDGPDLVKNLLKLTRNLVNCGRITLYLFDDKKKELYFAFGSKGLSTQRISYGSGFAGWVALHKTPMNVKDVRMDRRFSSDKDVQLLTRAKARSVLVVPILTHDTKVLLGVLQLINKKASPGDPVLQDSKAEEDNLTSKHYDKRLSMSLPRGHTGFENPVHRRMTTTTTPPLDRSLLRMGSSGPRMQHASQKGTFLKSGSLDDSNFVLGKKSRSTILGISSQDKSVPLTCFKPFDKKVCELVCARIAQAIRSKLVHFEQDKAIADDRGDILSSMLPTEKPRAKSDIGVHKTSFLAVGKFLTVLKGFRKSRLFESGKSIEGCIDEQQRNSIDTESNQTLACLTEKYLADQTVPTADLLQRLNRLHNQALKVSSHEEGFSSLGYDILDIKTPKLLDMIVGAFFRLGLVHKFRIEESVLYTFLVAVERKYLNNPYHNFHHASAVFQQIYSILLKTRAPSFLYFQDILALLVASICHDIGHRGRTNDFESKILSDLAIQYNDRSILEQYHASQTFALMISPKTNVMRNLSTGKFKKLRELVIHHILLTDMKYHTELHQKMTSIVTKSEKSDEFIINRENETDRETFSSFLLHCCDIGAQTLSPEIAKRWSNRVLNEFMLQAKEEEALKVKVTPHMMNLDDPVTRANVQIGFIRFLVEPAWQTLTDILPNCKIFLINLKQNIQYYEDIKEKAGTETQASNETEEEVKEGDLGDSVEDGGIESFRDLKGFRMSAPRTTI
mmetsp:Transcript_15149/g.26687  ORF Transcript_15149/g.26687 Transcript_15149/m.26687 type:complete len:1104 (-) Transcript_15149:2805-6116(-)